ncbi:chlorohydrolase family protein [Aspergillus stella-maris]|uniref:chlorohydrolase family protein n=1 Tax=Aspergillus stella-maris TaxID=1810926 RepID=UPI003CCE3F30
MGPKVLLCHGTFIDLPQTKTGSKHELRIRHGALWVSPVTGRIEGVDWGVSSDADLKFLLHRKGWKNGDVEIVRADEGGNEFFFPGFIDTHIHAPQYPNSGLFGSSTLLDWLERYTFPLESSMSNLDTARKAYSTVISRTLSHGTTYASYFATIHVDATNLLADLAFEKGQRALVGRVCMDNPHFCPEYYIDESEEGLGSTMKTEETISHIHKIDPEGRLVKPIVTPRFVPTCTPASLTSLGELASRYDPPLHIQTHISENLNEVSLVRDLFPGDDTPTYASVYDKFSLLTPRTILAHAVHLTPSEQDLIASRDSKISHCPASNSALGSGLAPVRALLEKGITVGLGTDVSGGYSPSILESVRQACLVSRLLRHAKKAPETKEGSTALAAPKSSSSSESGELVERESETGEKKRKEGYEVLPVEESLYLATRGGAAVVDMPADLGGFEAGMFFDAQLVRLDPPVSLSLEEPGEGKGDSPVDIFGWESWVEKVHKWVWTGDDRNVRSVWVGGRLVHRIEDRTEPSVFGLGIGSFVRKDWVKVVAGSIGVAALGVVLGRRVK